jgi:hypothetical protein
LLALLHALTGACLCEDTFSSKFHTSLDCKQSKSQAQFFHA